MNFLVYLTIIFFNLNNTCWSKTTTTKTNKQTTKLTKCYESVEGKYYGKSYNQTLKEISCETNCISFQIKNNTEKIEMNGCSIDKEVCKYYPLFEIKNNNYSYKESCCDTNLCNTPEFHSKNLNYKCVLNKTVSKNMKLTYKVRNLKAKSVNQCYSCSNCTKESEFKIEKCTGKNIFACEVK